jgi:hypothetical protein
MEVCGLVGLAITARATDAWTARLVLPATAAVYETKRLRLRLLAVAGRLVHRTARRTTLKTDPASAWGST